MGVRIRRAEQGDRERIVRLLDTAFMDDPVSGWVFPGEEYRRARHAGLMGVFTDATLAEGYADLLEDGSAVALWMDVPDHPHADADPDAEENGPAQVREAVDPDNARIEEIARTLDRTHPQGRAHTYLWMIGVAPGRQGEGLGTSLMAPVLERCDREGRPAYLEASSARSRALYERLGFAFTGTAIELPDGPTMWPMWREPQAG
ncbi:GNAT family N-acetyltransferase [Streptomyces sp. VRA16 Mangrove soil]|uniref:GNAT family N-acetyltransferase n=1 Tax=Streptomyces sp. VRA16 Mangrove soil TaxID=2817434 RepID=UPI001A9E4E8C|nr:GNAT family N-acetyltransferase [Streptomyces sp. VRA16 Mangrove soil]MBO1336126.1 GNAT family N-acetyltransferase [Streptomyces sp. VRA16 Mangrove soil]